MSEKRKEWIERKVLGLEKEPVAESSVKFPYRRIRKTDDPLSERTERHFGFGEGSTSPPFSSPRTLLRHLSSERWM